MLSESYSSPLTLPPGTSTPVGPAELQYCALSDYLLTYSYLCLLGQQFPKPTQITSTEIQMIMRMTLLINNYQGATELTLEAGMRSPPLRPRMTASLAASLAREEWPGDCRRPPSRVGARRLLA